MPSLSEADTCRKYVVPKLQLAGWDNEPHSIAEQRTITDGRIVPVGKGFVRKPPRRVDYLLRYERNFPLAVVEAKGAWKTAGDGLQQAKDYAEMLGLKFAYATNGEEIVEFDYFTGKESLVSGFPTPAQLWGRYRGGSKLADDAAAERLLTPINHTVRKGERYYQEIAINRAVEGILKGNRRQLLPSLLECKTFELPVTDTFVARKNDPIVPSRMREPRFVFGTFGKVLSQAFDRRAGIAQRLDYGGTVEGLVDEEDERVRRP